MAKKNKRTKNIRNDIEKTRSDSKYGVLLKYLPLIPPFICLFIIFRYGINIMFWDEFQMIDLVRKLDNSTLSFWDLLPPHNEHRSFFFYLVYLGAGKLTGFSSKAAMFISFAIICLGYLCFSKYFKDTVKDDSARYIILTVVGLFMFSPVQYENLLWGYQIGFAMAATIPVISIFFLYKYLSSNIKGYFILSIVVGIIASFSSLPGLLVWPAVLLALISRYGKGFYKKYELVLWSISGCVCWVLYFYKFDRMSQHGNHLEYITRHPVRFFIYILEVIGNVIINNKISALIGIIIILLAGFVAYSIFKNRKIQSEFFPAALLLLGLLTTGVISYGRAILQAPHSSRYTTFTLYIFIALFIYFSGDNNLFNIKRNFKKFRIKACALLAIAILLSYPIAIRYCRYMHVDWINKELITVNYAEVPDENLYSVYIDAEHARDYLDYLRENNYSAFKN